MNNSYNKTKAPQIPLFKTEAKESADSDKLSFESMYSTKCALHTRAGRVGEADEDNIELFINSGGNFHSETNSSWYDQDEDELDSGDQWLSHCSRGRQHNCNSLQSAEEEEDDEAQAEENESEFMKMLSLAAPALKALTEHIGTHIPFTFGELYENFRILRLMVRNSKTYDDYFCVLQASFRLFKGVVITDVAIKRVRDLLTPARDVQSSGPEEVISALRSMFDYTTCVTESELVKKLVKVYSFMLTQGYLKTLGLELNDEEYSKAEQRAFLSAYSSKKSFICCVIDTSLFLCQRLIEFRKSGDTTVFLKSGKAFDDWLSEADRILNLAPFVGNLEVHGTSYFSFLADLRDLIEKGSAIVRFTRARTGDDSKVVSMKLARLQLLQNTEITRRSAQMERKAPMAALITGGSSIAKSSFSKILFNYYGALFNLDHSDEYRYVRDPVTEYWTNFDSSKWCIQLDDLAFMNPNKCPDLDSTLKEIILVVNNVPYVPPQAALEDKGRTPVMAQLVLGTTNSEDLNASEYFWCPLAVRRRMPFVIRLKPKAEFTHENGRFIDPNKIVTEEGKFSDLWEIEVCKVVPEMRHNREFAKLESVRTFSAIDAFLQYFGKACVEHDVHQDAAMAKDKDMQTIEVCPACYAPLPHDECVMLQYGILPDSNFVTLPWVCLLLLPYLPWESILSPLQSLWKGYFAFFCQIVVISYLCRERILGYGELLHHYEGHVSPAINIVVSCVSVVLGIVYSIIPSRATISNSFNWVAEKLIEIQTFRRTMRYVSRIRAGRFVLMKFFNAIENERLHVAYVSLAVYEKRKKGLKILVGLLAIASSAFALYTTYKKYSPTKAASKVVDEDEVSSESPDMNVQAEVSEADQFVKESTANVWYNPQVELTTFDMPLASTSLVGIDADGVRNLLHKNCVLLYIRGRGDKYKRVMRGVMLAGHKCLTNAHAFRADCEWFTVRVIQSDDSGAFKANQEFEIHRTTVAFSSDTDICIFDVECLPPFRSIMKYWRDSDHNPTSCLQLKRSDNGAVVEKRTVYNLNFIPKMKIPVLEKTCDIYMGDGEVETAIGDCGSLCISITGRGPYIFGIHILGRERMTGILSIKRSEIESLLKHPALSTRPIVQAGFMPLMEVESRKHVLGALHHKSMVRYVDGGVAKVYGSFIGFRPKPKSKVCATPLQAEMLAHYEREVEYGPPAMSGWEPWRNNLITMVRPKSIFDRRILRECSKAFLADILAGLDSDQLGELVVLSDRAAVNGIPGVKYIDKLNTNTSMGFPWCKTKKQFLVDDITEEYPEGVTFEKEVWDIVRFIEDEYALGNRVNAIFFGCLKDEAQPWKKILIKKTRLFMGGPLPWGIVVRKQLLPFVRLLQRNPTLFECSVGLPAQSPAWGSLRDHLTTFGEERMVAGDYKFFDKEMIAEFILEAFDIIIGVYRKSGADETRLRTIACIAEDIAFPVCNVNGDLFEFFGSNPSGQPLTVILNSLVNSLYLRYAYRVLNPLEEVETFKENVAATTYGDDNVFGVSVNAPWYNHTTIQSALADIGLTYTMADKTGKSVPYIHIDDVSFLKRSWKWCEDVSNYTCPLEEDSIIKSLTVWTPSGAIDEYAQMHQVITSANNEYFFHGKEIFQEKHEFFNELLRKEPYSFYAAPQPLPTYDQLVARFLGPQAPVNVTIDNDEGNEPPLRYDTWFANSIVKDPVRENGTAETVADRTVTPSGSEKTHEEIINFLTLQSSDVVDLPTRVDSVMTSEVVTFVDDSAGQIDSVETGISSIASMGATSNTDLGQFLKRPTLIDTRSWSTSTTAGTSGTVIEPWYLFLNNPLIRNKLNNYAFLRAKLCIKVIINATPFHYGSMRVSYEPNVNTANNGSRKSKVRTNPFTDSWLITPYSQLPGVWLSPADNAGGEIHVPFFRHTNWLPLRAASDVRTMGTLNYFVAFPLTVASATGSPSISINTYAWMEDVELAGSTNELTLQAKDEYDGSISAPARAVASAAAKFESVPVIGKFAKATSIGAGALSSIAGLFGFTNVPVIDDVQAVVPVGGVHLASSEIGTPVQKLALDPKQELSIDPSLHGLGDTDEMAIAHIASKKSTLPMVTWSTSDAVGKAVWIARVNPGLFGRLYIQNSGGSNRAIRVYHSTLSYLGMMFTHWRGDIVFEVEAICTKFHKGRLQITWDPIGNGGTVAAPENSAFTTILDIGENNKALFRVPFHQATEWCRTRGVSTINWNSGSSSLGTERDYDNGLFTIHVLTPLMSPVSPQNIGIKISVYGANVEYANPKSTLADSSAAAPPTVFDVQSRDVRDTEASMVTFGDTSGDHPERYGLNFGERIVSLRTLLHRYSLYDVTAVKPADGTRAVHFMKSYNRLPPMYGYDGQGESTAALLIGTGNGFFTYSPTHPITYVSLMYGGATGGVNFIANIASDLQSSVGDVRVQRITDNTHTSSRNGRTLATIDDGESHSAYTRFLNQTYPASGAAGAAYTNTLTNGSINWNYPMMTHVNFMYTDPSFYMQGNPSDFSRLDCSLLEILVKQNANEANTKNITVTSYAATGPDFNCLWWLCCPTLDYYLINPPSA